MNNDSGNDKRRLNGKRIGIEQPQPSPEAKKAGWERRRQAQEMMNKVREYMKMPQSEFMALLQDIKNNPDKYTVEDAMLYKYATKAFNGEKFMLDWFDRNISKAPSEIKQDITSGGKPIPILGGITNVPTDDSNQKASDAEEKN